MIGLRSGKAARVLRRLFLFGGMQPSAVLFLHLFGRNNSASEVGELNKLLLDCLQAFIPLLVSGLNICAVAAVAAKLLI